MKLLQEKLNEFGIELTDEQMKLFEEYRDILISNNKKFNLTSITEPDDIEILHFIDSINIIPYIRECLKSNQKDFNGLNLIDVGTGAGFPGIPLKIIFPKLNLVLVDSLNKKVNFLKELTEQLKLEGVSCIHSRAEDLARDVKFRDKFDISIARALAPMNLLSEYCMPFVKTGGIFIAMKSKNEEEIINAKNAIKLLGGEIKEIKEYYLKKDDLYRKLIIIKKNSKTPHKYPRKAGIPKKNPII